MVRFILGVILLGIIFKWKLQKSQAIEYWIYSQYVLNTY